MIAAITVISFSSCTVRYHARRQPYRHHRDYNYMPEVNKATQTVSLKLALPHSFPATN